jgi:hypothetical protein
MKKSESLFGRLILKVGRTPDKAGQHCCRVNEMKTWRTNRVWSTSFVENTSRPNPLRNLRNQRQKICRNPVILSKRILCALVPLWLKINQSKQLNYAKRTQFSKKSNVYNSSINNN